MGETLSAFKQLSRPSVRPPTKLSLGAQNPIQPRFKFRRAEQVPFDPTALYSYLMAQAERRFLPATAHAMAMLFETEFYPATVPPKMITEVTDALRRAGMASAGLQDDLRRVALVELFVRRYTWVYADAPETLFNPACVRITYANWLASLPNRIDAWL